MKVASKKKATKKATGKKVNRRTAKGNIPEAVRDRTATLANDRFPIFDQQSAESALRLRGRGTSPEERKKIIRKAAKFSPAKAKAAQESDKKNGKI